ncbi:tyrosine-type recombinase/integrase [Lapillicoccus sp.]|uniref:tyrosine-type recombinase/integrase n=1 Tax=Lapillicoccus sp. TaxID=1909287 RepID=UPI003983D3FF
MPPAQPAARRRKRQKPGPPTNPGADQHWKELLTEAGIRDSRLHDARHTAATVLRILGVSQPMIMSVMDWSNPAMT